MCDNELLGYCLNGSTQNSKEAVNQTVWEKYPKDTFISRIVLEIGVASAVINFNDGMSGFKKLFSRLNLSFRVNTKSGAIEKDQQRIKNMNNKFQETKNEKEKAKSSQKELYRQRKRQWRGKVVFNLEFLLCSVIFYVFKTFFHTLQKSIYELNKNMNFSRSTNAFELKFSGDVQ